MRIFRRQQDGDNRTPVPVPPAARRATFWPFFGSRTTIPYVSSDNILGVPALWRGINMIANAVATASPCHIYEGDNQVETPVVISQPDPEMGTFDWYHSTVAQIVVTGNALFLPLDYVDGVPQQLLAVPEGGWHVRYGDNGRLVYTIAGEEMPSDRVLHIRGYTRTGDPYGVGVVTAFRQAIGFQLLDQDTSDAGIPSGIITVDTDELTAEQAELTKAQWLDKFGAGTARTPAILSNGMKFEPISFNAKDRQWIESRALGIAEAAFMLNLDPADLGAAVPSGTSNMTYANIESRQVDRITSSYGPIGRRIEEALQTLVPQGQVCRLNWERLLRTDSTSRATFLNTMIDAGVYSIEYAQHLEKVPAQYRTQQVAAV